jgi:thiamine monophosphate kinase
MNDGEDFELLFTLSVDEYEKLIDKWDMPTPISNIGLIRADKGISLIMKDGLVVEVTPKGYDHL